MDGILPVVVSDLHIVGSVVSPPKADPVLVVNPNAVLTLPVRPQLFEAVPVWLRQVVKGDRPVDTVQLPLGYLP